MRHYFTPLFALFFLGCAGIAKQGQPASPAPEPVAKRSVKRKTGKVVWVEVASGNHFWKTLKSSDKNVALIGTEICPPCKLAKAWWEEQIAPPGWQFVYWQLTNTDDYLTRSFKQIFLKLEQKDNLTLPYLSIIEGVGDPQREKKITETFSSFTNCTVGANKFLLMHPQGTVYF
ncbi:hypothetical protein GF391_02135 [Candidatus Uhrbacteria bacterium]|nr:hypothetical protein [Candidatus Uhrbacteria bacterium]